MSAYTRRIIDCFLVVVLFILILTTEDVHANRNHSGIRRSSSSRSHSGSHNKKPSHRGGSYSQPRKLSSFQTHNAAPSARASPFGWNVPPKSQGPHTNIHERPPAYNPAFRPALPTIPVVPQTYININLRRPARPADVAISSFKPKNFTAETTYQQPRQIPAGASPYQGPRNPAGLPPVGTFSYTEKPKKSTISSKVGDFVGHLAAGAMKHLNGRSRSDDTRKVAASNTVISNEGSKSIKPKATQKSANTAGDRVCVTIKVPQPDPKNSTKVIEVDQIACFSAPPMQIHSTASHMSRSISKPLNLISIMVTFFLAYCAH